MSHSISCELSPLSGCITIISKVKPDQLTFALYDIEVELLNGPHADLFQLSVQQHLHQGRGQMLAGRHAGCLGHFTLQREGRSGGRIQDNEGEQMTQRTEG